MADPNTALIHIGPTLIVSMVVLVGVAMAVNHWTGTGVGVHTGLAVLRAVVQLAALAAVLAVVISVLWASILFVVVMAMVASWTSAGRVLAPHPTVRGAVWCLLPVALPTIIIVFGLVASGVIPATGIAIIPTAGIMFGGAMNTTSLAGRRAEDELQLRHGEVDAARALGLHERDARLEIIRTATSRALIPGIDQTRSVGLVTIPGAFVGMVLGGASTSAAAIMQLFVLVALLAVSAIAVAVTAELVARESL